MSNPLLPVEQWSPEQIAKCGWTRDQVIAWSRGTWTPQKIDALELVADQHIDNCDACQERLQIDPATLPGSEAYYCPIGESLSKEYSQAQTEYSWQPDFRPGQCNSW
jgi:hypothetical protein